MRKKGHNVYVVWATDGRYERGDDSYYVGDTGIKACEVLGISLMQTFRLGFPDQKLDTVPHLEMNQALEALPIPPMDMIFTHAATDVNLDHVQVRQSALVYARPKPEEMQTSVIGCEVLSSSEWGEKPFMPNFWRKISHNAVAVKCQALACYSREVQERPHPRSSYGVNILAQYRGLECGEWFAEAFEIIRLYEDAFMEY